MHSNLKRIPSRSNGTHFNVASGKYSSTIKIHYSKIHLNKDPLWQEIDHHNVTFDFIIMHLRGSLFCHCTRVTHIIIIPSYIYFCTAAIVCIIIYLMLILLWSVDMCIHNKTFCSRIILRFFVRNMFCYEQAHCKRFTAHHEDILKLMARHTYYMECQQFQKVTMPRRTQFAMLGLHCSSWRHHIALCGNMQSV